jgi:hypothetical protein
MTLPELVAELHGHELDIRTNNVDGRTFGALFVDGTRVSDWQLVPGLDCHACKARRRAPRRRERVLGDE